MIKLKCYRDATDIKACKTFLHDDAAPLADVEGHILSSMMGPNVNVRELGNESVLEMHDAKHTSKSKKTKFNQNTYNTYSQFILSVSLS